MKAGFYPHLYENKKISYFILYSGFARHIAFLSELCKWYLHTRMGFISRPSPNCYRYLNRNLGISSLGTLSRSSNSHEFRANFRNSDRSFFAIGNPEWRRC